MNPSSLFFFLTFALLWHIIIMKGSEIMDKRAITDRLDYAIRLIQYVRDNLEQNPQELIVARRLLLEAYNKSKAMREVTI